MQQEEDDLLPLWEGIRVQQGDFHYHFYIDHSYAIDTSILEVLLNSNVVIRERLDNLFALTKPRTWVTRSI